MKNYMIKCMQAKKVVSLFCDNDNPGTHLTGIIDFMNDNEVLIRHISPNGYYDGFILIHINDVFRVDSDGAYEKKVQELYTLRNQTHPELVQAETLYDTLLQFCKEQERVASVELPNCALRGVLVSYCDQYVHMLLADENGKPDGETIISSDEIISIAVDTTIEQNIRLLLANGCD